MLIWFLVAYFYKGEPPPTFDPPIDINAEFGKQYFQPPEVIEKECSIVLYMCILR